MKQKILLVDDDKVNTTYLQFGLKQQEYDVVSAYDGDEALAKVVSEQPDLIILDVQMPNMSGFEFLTELKIKGEDKDIPILMLTANENMEDVFKAEGVKGYFVKPVKMEELVAKIEEIFA